MTKRMAATTVEERTAAIETIIPTLATKEDVAQLESCLDARLAQLEVSMAQLESRIIRWMVGIQIATIATIVTLVAAINVATG